MAYVESDLCLQIRPQSQTQIPRNVDRNNLIRPKNCDNSSKTSTYCANPANLASAIKESLSPIQSNPLAPPIFLNERENPATNTSEYLAVNPVLVDASSENNNTINNLHHIASKGAIISTNPSGVNINNYNAVGNKNCGNKINNPPGTILSPSGVGRVQSGALVTPFSSSCSTITSCSASSAPQTHSQVICPNTAPELDCSGANRKRPLVEVFEDSENSPKRHSMEGLLHNLKLPDFVLENYDKNFVIDYIIFKRFLFKTIAS